MTPAPIPKDDILDDIRRVADELGRTPSSYAYREHGCFSARPAYRHFDSWQEAIEAAGLEPEDGRRTQFGLERKDPEDLGLSPIGEVPHS